MSGHPRPRRRILVAGGPRMGTTWVGRVLGTAERTLLIHEPDNEWPNLFALKAKIPLGRFPVLSPGDDGAEDYRRIWEWSFDGYRPDRVTRRIARRVYNGRTDPDLWRALCDHANQKVTWQVRALTAMARPARRGPRADAVVVKSVYAPFALEWIADVVGPTLLLVKRNPLNVIGSWKENGWGGCALETNPRIWARYGEPLRLPELPPGSSPMARVAWEVGLIASVLDDLERRHPDWPVATHEDLCVDPVAKYRRLFEVLGIAWTYESEDFLQRANRPGAGFSVNRVTSELPERWRKRLDREELREIWSVLSAFTSPWVEQVAADLA